MSDFKKNTKKPVKKPNNVEDKNKNVAVFLVIAIVVFVGLIFLGMKLLGVGNRGGSDNTTATENNDVETFKSENDSFLYKNGQEYPLALFMSVSDYHLGSEADESVEIKGSKEDGFECEENGVYGFPAGCWIYNVPGMDDCYALKVSYYEEAKVFMKDPEKYYEKFDVMKVDWPNAVVKIYWGTYEVQGYSYLKTEGFDDLKEVNYTPEEEPDEIYLATISEDILSYEVAFIVEDDGTYIYDIIHEKAYFTSEILRPDTNENH